MPITANTTKVVWPRKIPYTTGSLKKQLASERNWRLLQLKGAIGNLEHLINSMPMEAAARQLYLRDLAGLGTLQNRIEEDWNYKKAALEGDSRAT